MLLLCLDLTWSKITILDDIARVFIHLLHPLFYRSRRHLVFGLLILERQLWLILKNSSRCVSLLGHVVRYPDDLVKPTDKVIVCILRGFLFHSQRFLSMHNLSALYRWVERLLLVRTATYVARLWTHRWILFSSHVDRLRIIVISFGHLFILRWNTWHWSHELVPFGLLTHSLLHPRHLFIAHFCL